MHKSLSTTRRHVAQLAARAGAVTLLAAGLTVASSSSSQAVFNAVQAQHFIDCAGWLLSDPEMHAANCSPSRVALSLRSLTEPVTGTIIDGPATPSNGNGNNHECNHEHHMHDGSTCGCMGHHPY